MLVKDPPIESELGAIMTKKPQQTGASAPRRHHDTSYRKLFSHPEMVRDLLTGYVRQDWLEMVDLATLEPVKGSFVTDDDRDRADDVIWRVRWGDGWLYVYLLIEFQSTIDEFMAVRISAYVSLLYQDLIAQKAVKAGDRLPPVLPIVLYNGEPRWRAETELSALIESVPGGLERYRPRWSYLLLDEGAIVQAEGDEPQLRNLVAALFGLEKARDEATWLAVYARLIEWLDSAALDSLKRAFGRWIYRSFIRKKRPEITLPEIDDFHEVHIMLQQRVEQWNAEILERGRRLGLEEGRQEGREEGRQEGREEGRRAEMIDLIQGLAQSRFGVLSPELVQRITALPLERGKALVVAFLDFSSVADLEDWLRGSGSFGDRS